MVQRNKAPLLSPLSEPALLPYNRFMLPNGIEVVYIHDPAQEVFKIDVIFEAGIYYQSRPLIASTAINMLNEGTLHHHSEEIADLFDYYGAYIDFNCGLNKSELSLISLSKYAEPTLNMLVEMLTESIVPEKERSALIKNVHTTPHGLPCVWPQMERYAGTPGVYARHSGVIWPQVNAAWCSALTACGERELAFHETELLAEKAFRDKMFHEVYHPDTGLPYGGIQEKGTEKGVVEWASCPRQTWAATGFVHMVLRSFLGLHADEDGLTLSPVFPGGCEEIRLDGLHYRNAVLNLRIRRGASEFRHIPADITGDQTIQI